MKLKYIILFGLLFSIGVVNAQTDFRPGYIIKNAGDTIYGDIDYRGDLLMGSLCKFRDMENEIKEYSPNDIAEFRFIGSKYFISKRINGKSAFLEFLIRGKVNIYYLRDENGDHYYIDKEGEKLSEIPYEEGVKYVDNEPKYFKSKKHIGVISYYMQDVPEFSSRIQSMKKPGHNSLISLAKDYNKVLCEGEKCLVYVKKQSFIKVNIEGVAGVLNFENKTDYIDKNYFQSGIIAHFWLPELNEKFYLKAGLLYSQVEDLNNLKIANYEMLAHLGYLAPKTYRIRPSFSIGLISASYSGGVAVKINKNINLGVQALVNFDSKNIVWIPGDLASYSLLGSIYFEL